MCAKYSQSNKVFDGSGCINDSIKGFREMNFVIVILIFQYKSITLRKWIGFFNYKHKLTFSTENYPNVLSMCLSGKV